MTNTINVTIDETNVPSSTNAQKNVFKTILSELIKKKEDNVLSPSETDKLVSLSKLDMNDVASLDYGINVGSTINATNKFPTEKQIGVCRSLGYKLRIETNSMASHLIAIGTSKLGAMVKFPLSSFYDMETGKSKVDGVLFNKTLIENIKFAGTSDEDGKEVFNGLMNANHLKIAETNYNADKRSGYSSK